MAPPELVVRGANEPLLSPEDAATLIEDESSADLWTARSLAQEASRLLQLSIPLAVQYVFAYTTLLVSTAFCGHLGSFQLSVAVLSTSIYNVLGNSILIGFSSAIETLCGMAYGARNYAKMGVLLQRAVIVTSGVFVLICLGWLGMAPLLRLAGQQADLARAAAHYLHLSTPALFFNGCINCVLQRYLQAQGIVYPITVAFGIIAIFLAPLQMWLFINVLGLGLDGAPLATGANNACIAFALLAVTCWREWKLRGTEMQMWHGWSWRAFSGLGTYVSLAIPSTGMICLQWWAFEVVVLMAGNLADPELAVAVMGILMNLDAALYMIARGMSGAASTRVSNELGAGRPHHAKQAAWTAVCLSGATGAALALGCSLLRHQLVRIFTTDPRVLEAALRVFGLMCASVFTDSVNCSIEGVIRGSGKQSLAASINVITYWGVGIASAWYFAFPLNLRVAGFWYSRLLSTAVQMLVMLVVLLLLYDWEALAELAVAHIAAATPRASDGRKLSFGPTPEDAELPETEPIPTLPTLSTAVSIRRRELHRSDSTRSETATTPQYSYTPAVTMGGSFAAR